MENPPAPVPGDEPSDDAEGGATKPFPPFKPAEDGVQDVHMEAGESPAIGTLVAKGKEFGPEKADARSLGELIRSYAVAIYRISLARKGVKDWVAWPAVSRLGFGSAEIDFVAGENEMVRMEDPISPSVEAARHIADLMNAQGDDLVALAQEAGPEGAKAYRQVLKAIGESEDAEICWKSPGRDPVVVTSVGAATAYQTLAREGDSQEDVFKVVGHLTMADDELNRFKLKLFEGAPRPPQVKGKRIVRGTYDDPLGQLLKEKGLWGKDVEAEVRIERERPDTVATPRDPRFTLLSVEAATAPPPGKKGSQPIPGSATLSDEVFGD